MCDCPDIGLLTGGENTEKMPENNWLLIFGALSMFVLGHLLLPLLILPCEKVDVLQVVLSTVSGPLGGLILILLFWRCKLGSCRCVAEMLHLGRFPWKMFLMGLPLALLILAVSGTITLVWEIAAVRLGIELEEPYGMQKILSGSCYEMAVFILNALLVAPLLEEIIFRRAISDTLRPFIGRWASWLSALAFGAVHCSLMQLPGLICMALIWQKIYDRSGNLWSSVILHFFNNCISVGALVYLRFQGLL